MPMPMRDLSGQRFGRILVKHRVENAPNGALRWLCICDCGTEKSILGYTLTQGQSRSCGCVRSGPRAAIEKFDRKFKPQKRARLSIRFVREYRSWNSMQERCNNPKATKFHLYGGRGIKVCERWNKFANFLADMGKRPINKTLDRKDSNLGYSRENCRWATLEEQMDSRRITRLVTNEHGEKVSLRAFAISNKVPLCKLRYHFDKGHDVNRCVLSMKESKDGKAKCDKRWKI